VSLDVPVATSAGVSVQRRWTWIAQGYGLAVSAVLSYFLLGLVIQVSDSFGNLLAIQKPTLGELVRDQLSQHAYLRPLLWAQIKIIYEWSGGDYYAWFRGLHVAQVCVLIALCVRLMRPTTALDLALVPLSSRCWSARTRSGRCFARRIRSTRISPSSSPAWPRQIWRFRPGRAGTRIRSRWCYSSGRR
jgi:hypothetical protein